MPSIPNLAKFAKIKEWIYIKCDKMKAYIYFCDLKVAYKIKDLLECKFGFIFWGFMRHVDVYSIYLKKSREIIKCDNLVASNLKAKIYSFTENLPISSNPQYSSYP